MERSTRKGTGLNLTTGVGGNSTTPFLLTPLGLILASCGGSGSSSGSSGVSVSQDPPSSSNSSSSSTVTGNVVKGPLENALVFLDYDSDGIQDSGEPSVYTDSDGAYSLSASSQTYSLVAITDDNTIDSSTGTVLTGVTLKAPSGSTVVTPTTTLIQEGDLTTDAVAEVLGLPEGIDPLTFNPFATGVDAAKALEMEKISQQVMSVVTSFAAASEGAGATAADSFKASINSFVEVIKTKSNSSSKQLDLTNSTDLQLIQTEVTSRAASLSGIDTTAFNSLANDTRLSIKNVNDQIELVTDHTSQAAKNAFSNTQVLRDQVKAAVEAEKSSAGSGSIDFKNSTNVANAASNAPPTNITLSSTSITENGGATIGKSTISYVVGTLNTVDSDSSSGYTYSISDRAGLDGASFVIDQQSGTLGFKNAPDFETKSSYKVLLVSKDPGGKSIAKEFSISVADANDAPVITSTPATASFEDSLFSYTFKATDPDTGDSLTYSAPILDSWLSFNSATGVLSGTPDQGQVGTTTVTLLATDSKGLASTQTFTITITNVNDKPVLTISGQASIAENVTQAEVATLSASDQEDTTATIALTGSGADDSSFEIVNNKLRIKTSADYETQSVYYVQISATDSSGAKTIKNLEIKVTDAAETVSGKIVDGYVAGATIFQDLDNDNVLDSGEPSTTTSATGSFSLSGVVSSATAPLKMISGFDIGTNNPIVTSLGVPTTAAGNVIVSPIGTVATSVQASDALVNISTIVDRVATYFGVSDTSQQNLDLINDDPIQSLKSGSSSVVSAARDAFEANQYMMALAHTAETIAAYASSIVDNAIQTALSNKGVSGISAKAGSSLSTYEKMGADAFMSQSASRFSSTGNTIDITDETELKIYVANAGAYEGDATPTAVVYLNHAHTEDVTLNYTFSSETGNTATAGSDFTATSGTVKILAGLTSATINLPLLSDNNTESLETFSLNITGASAGTVAVSKATISVVDSTKTIASSGELSTLSDLIVTKALNDVATGLTTAYNSHASSNSLSWTVDNATATTAVNSILPGLKVISDIFYSVIKTKIDAQAGTSDIDAFAENLMIANAATKQFDPSAFIGTNINGDGSYPSGQSLSTLTSAIQSAYDTANTSATNTSGDVFGTDTSANFANATVSTLTDGNDNETLTSASEIIATFNGDDTVNAGGGNDKVLGGTGTDTFNGQAGDDHLYGFSGNDILSGGDGNDKIVGGLGNDTISGGSGNDTILGQTGDDTVTTGSGNDDVTTGLGDDAITVNGTGTKTISGGAGTDTLTVSTSGISNLGSFASIERTSASSSSGDRTDAVYKLTYSNGDTISFSSIENLTVGSVSYTNIDPTENQNAFWSSSEHKVYLYQTTEGGSVNSPNPGNIYDFAGFSSSTPLGFVGTSANDSNNFNWDRTSRLTADLTIDFGAGNDTIAAIRTLAGDSIDMGEGDDHVSIYVNSGEAVNVHSLAKLDGGTGTDTLSFSVSGYGEAGATLTLTHRGATNFENLTGTSQSETINGDSNANILMGSGGADTINGYAGDDTLDAGNGDSLANTLNGGSGDDTLKAYGGADILDGGTGADTITTGSGSDTIILRSGDGGGTVAAADIITDFSDGIDALGLAGSLSFASLTIVQGSGSNANDTLISITSTGEYLAVLQGISATNVTGSDFMSMSSSALTLSGTSGNDTLIGGASGDTATTAAGVDTIITWSGDDAITVNGTGTKTISGGAGTDTLTVSTSGISNLGSFASIERTSASSSSGDRTDAVYKLTYSNGDTISFSSIENLTVGSVSYTNIDPTENQNAFWSSSEHKVYLYQTTEGGSVNSPNPGNIYDFAGFSSSTPLGFVGTSANDSNNFNWDRTSRLTADLTIDFGAGNDTIAAIRTLAGDSIDMGEGDDHVSIYVNSGEAVNVHSLAKLDGGTGTDTLSFSVSGYGEAGATLTLTHRGATNFENLTGTSQSETINGDSNANILMGSGGADTINGYAGDDTLYAKTSGSSGTDNVILNGGAGNDTLFGQEGDDTLDGDIGADTITTGSGSDTVILRSGSGGNSLTDADTIKDFTDGTDVFGLDNKLVFGNLSISQGTGPNSSHAIIRVGSSGEFLALVENINASSLTEADFTPVSITNYTPAIDSTAVTSVNEDSLYSYTLTATDKDAGDTVTLSATTKPAWLSFNAGSGVLSGTPNNSHVGTHSVTLKATDGNGAMDTQSFTITVNNVNDAPTITSTAVTSVNQGSSYSYTVAASDVDSGDSISYSAPTKPSWLNINSSSGALTGTPSNADVGTHSIVLKATDAAGATDTESFTLTVNNVNDAPTITSIAVTSVNEDVAYSYTFAANDVDSGDSVTLSAQTKPSWLSFNAGTGVLSGTPSNSHVGNHSVTLRATDSNGVSTDQSFTITVTNVNDAPTITSTAVTSVNEDAGYSYTFAASDVDSGDSVTLSAPTKPSWLSFNAGTGVLSGTPSNSHVGSHSIVLKATDSAGAVDTQSFTITVNNVNDAPVITSSAITSVNEDSGYSYTFAANDEESGDSVTLSALTKPSWLNFNAETGVLSGTPTNSNVGNHSVTLRATDSNNVSTDQSFTIAVSNVNDAPTITSSAVTSVNEDSGYSYEFTASDVDSGDNVTLSAHTKPSWLSFDPGTGVLAGTPTNVNVGSHSIVLKATDTSGAVDSQSFTITVNNVNDAPVITSSAITSVNEDSGYSYTFAASDVDSGDSLTLSAQTKPSWLDFNAATGVLSGTPTNSDVGSHSVALKATDGSSAVDTQSFTITVNNVNDAPTITSTPVTEATGGSGYTYTFAASDIDSGDTLTLSAPTKPSWLSFNAGTGVLSGTPSNSDAGNHTIVLKATDGSGATDTQTFNINVSPSANNFPTITSTAVTSVNEDVEYSYTFAANDTDSGDSVTLSAPSTPSWLSFNAGTGVLSGTPNNSHVGSHSITLRATDSSNAYVEQSFTITVNNVNDAPTITSTAVTTVNEDAGYSYTFAASDADSGDSVTLSAPTTPSWLSFNAGTGVLSGTPSNSDVGNYSVVLKATDSSGAVDTQSFTLTVDNVNDAPTITSTAVTSVNEDVGYSYTFAANDVDSGDSVTLSAQTKPSWLSFNAGTGVLSGTPNNSHVGNHSITLRSTDSNGVSTDQSFTLTVNNVNDAPTITSTAVTSVNEDVGYSYTFAANDVDSGDSVTLSAQTKPSWLSFNAGTGVLSGTPNNSHVGNHSITLRATDSNGVSTDQSFTITVNNVNDAPTITSTAVTSVNEDVGYSYTFAASDDDGDDLTLSKQTIPSWLSFNAGTGVLSGTPNNSHVGNHSVTLRATDSNGASTDQSFTITVNNVNDAPTNIALSANTVVENSAGATIGTLSATDLDGDSLTYTLGSGVENNSFEISGTTLKLKNSVSANYEANNVYDLTINVSDGSSTVSKAFAVNVNNVNEANTSYYYGKADENISGSLNPTNDTAIDYLMSGTFWGNVGSGIDLNYSFIGSNSKFSNYYDSWKPIQKNNAQNPSDILKSVFANALSDFSNVTLLNFNEISETGDVTGHLRIGTTSAEKSAFAYYPYPGLPLAGDMWFNDPSDFYNWELAIRNGSYWNAAFTHEIGHALGLAHTQDQKSLSGTAYGLDLTVGSTNNANPYSIMSYFEYVGETNQITNNSYSGPVGISINDIKALQYLYGVNEQHNSGDTVYTLDSIMGNTLSKSYFNTPYIYGTIWDGAGNDTFSWADQSTSGSINLDQGSFSYFGGISGVDDSDLANFNSFASGDGLLGIAYDCIIENAKGGSASDTIKGNSADNILYGGSGTGVKDTLTGNAGADTFVCTISDASTDINVADIVTDFTNGTDKIGLEDKSFSDLTISQVTSGSFSGDTKIVDTNSGKILLLLDDTDISLLDSSDFVSTDFIL